jgi:hypothetical protein
MKVRVSVSPATCAQETGHYEVHWFKPPMRRPAPSTPTDLPNLSWTDSSGYHRLAARRGRKKAILAVAHSILVIAYHLIRRQEPYHELGGDFFDDSIPKSQRAGWSSAWSDWAFRSPSSSLNPRAWLSHRYFQGSCSCPLRCTNVRMKIRAHDHLSEGDRIFVCCHESVEQVDPGIPRYHGLSPPVMGEHAGENLLTRDTPLKCAAC